MNSKRLLGLKWGLGSVLAALCMAPAAMAAPVDFTFDGSNGIVANTTFTVGAASVTVSGYYVDALATGLGWQAAGNITRADNALAVAATPGGTGWQIDSNVNLYEGILFDFGVGAPWTELVLTLSNLAANENLDIWVGNGLTLGNVASPLSGGSQLVSDANPGNPFAISSFGSRYLFVAASDDGVDIDACGSSTNCFRVDNIRVNVPEPTSIALAMLGLLGVAAGSRRRQTA